MSDVTDGSIGDAGSIGRPVRRGQWKGWSSSGVDCFYAIRYARLADPSRPRSACVPASAQLDVTDVTDVPIFPQLPSRLESVTGPAGRLNPQHEDAFFLNVWTPATADRLPVLVFLHGGAWASGGGAVRWYRGQRLAGEGVVVVTLNYRLGPAGHLDDIEPGQYHRPFEDLTLALRWVCANVSSLGGDPDQITLAGQSAGAWYAWSLAMLPMAAGLFRKVALLSIPQIRPWTPEHRTRFTEQVMSNLHGDGRCEREQLLNAGLQTLMATPRATGAMPPMYLPVAPDHVAGLLGAAEGGSLQADALYVRTTAHEMSVFLSATGAEAPSPQQMLRVLEERAGKENPPAQPSPRSWDKDYAKIVSLASWLEFSRFSDAIAASAARQGKVVVRRSFAALAGQPQFGAVHCIDLPFQFGNFADWVDAPMLAGWHREAFERLSADTRGDLIEFVKGIPPQDHRTLGEGAGPAEG